MAIGATDLSQWVTVALPQGGTVTIFGTPDSWPEWVKKLVREEGEGDVFHSTSED